MRCEGSEGAGLDRVGYAWVAFIEGCMVHMAAGAQHGVPQQPLDADGWVAAAVTATLGACCSEDANQHSA